MQARAKPPPSNPCPLCRSETHPARVHAISKRLAEWAVHCGTCLYVSKPQIGRDRAIHQHNEDWPNA